MICLLISTPSTGMMLGFSRSSSCGAKHFGVRMAVPMVRDPVPSRNLWPPAMQNEYVYFLKLSDTDPYIDIVSFTLCIVVL